MALQGDLKSFALPDVLRFLAGTTKSGRLQVDGPVVSGELCLREGAIVSGKVSTAPVDDSPAEVVFELLRADDGSFVFDEGQQLDDGPVISVHDALVHAEAMVAEWAEVEAVIPSMHAWVALAAELDDDGVHVSPDWWRAVASVAGGGSVSDLGSALALSDLAASRLVMELLDAGLVNVGASHFPAATFELDSFEEFESAVQAMTDLEHLGTDDRAVVMEDRDDALLPEPLPGEGVAYEGETITGAVDGRTFEAADTVIHEPAFEPAGAADMRSGFDADESFATLLDEADAGDAAPFSDDAEAAEYASETPATQSAIVPGGDQIKAGDTPGAEIDDERGSLLRFLSTVKP